MITKWCFDPEKEPISQHLKRRGKLTFDAGDNRDVTRQTQSDPDDINISNSWFLQEAETVKNVPGHDEKITEGKKTEPLSFVDSNYAFQNSIRGGHQDNFGGHDFNSFQEMINHKFHQNIKLAR